MRRRDILKHAAAMSSLSLISAVQVASATPTFRRIRPGDPNWPNAASWQRLNQAVGGKLIKGQSLLTSCAPDGSDSACADLEANLKNPFFLGDQPSGTQVSGWLNAWTPAPSAYVIHAHSSADVVAGVNFAREHRLRLVVKGTGHSYQGTSNAPDSLLIWTRAMTEVTVHDRFTPKGLEGKISPCTAVTAEAGAMWIDLYHAVTTEAGRYVQGGGCTDVGVAGLIQSGGFGSFSKGFGTAASNLLEAEIVTADGVARTVNAVSDPDLFWAIKGGGGGSWGVVTKLTLRTHELPQHFGVAWGMVKAHSDEALRRLIARFADHYAETLFNPHWGEQVSIYPDNRFEISMVCQGLEETDVKRAWTPFFAWIEANALDFTIAGGHGAHATDAQHWWDVEGNPSMTPDRRPNAPSYHGWWNGDQGQVGVFVHGFESLWLPASLLRVARRPQLADALFRASRFKRVQLHFNKGIAGAPSEAVTASLDTATNRVACEAFALAIIADGEGPAYPGMKRPSMDLDAAHADARQIDRANAELRKIVPDGGSYVSESNYFNPRWRSAFWGEHYQRLAAVKAKYDPNGLFFVHHGVGSEAWSADGFTRLD